MERDFRAELAEREAKHFKKKLGDGAAGPEDADPARLAAPADDDDDGPKFVPRDLDADDDDDDSDDDDSDDDEDDTAALLAELERIKKERAADAARREAEEMQLRAQEKAEELATGNPLLHLSEGGDRRRRGLHREAKVGRRRGVQESDAGGTRNRRKDSSTTPSEAISTGGSSTSTSSDARR